MMRPTWQVIMDLVGDTRISDKYFRWIFQEVTRVSFRSMMMRDRLKILREQAIIETERDEHTH